MERVNIHDLMQVDLPDGRVGDVAIEHFEIERNDLANVLAAFKGARDTRPGTYTRMLRFSTYQDVERSHIWMTDTDAERRDHFEAAYRIRRTDTRRVLIGGLGLGMILRVALLTPNVTHVDVVEVNENVIELVGPYYEALAAEHGKTLVIHHADVYDVRWPSGTRWNVAWFDIWGDVSTDDLRDMTRLRRSYGRRTDWNDCWGRHMLLRHREAGW